MSKLALISDLHGYLPRIPECDILIIAGDILPDSDQVGFLVPLEEWLKQVPAKHIVAIAGNHDYLFERTARASLLPWHYLLDEEIDLEGLKIYGTPWVPNLKAWAFYGGQEGCEAHKKIPEGLDVLISHGPPRGFGDRVTGGIPVGDTILAEELRRIRPKMFVCGHIHEGYGFYRHPHIERDIFNVAYVDEYYRPVHQAIEVVL